MSKGSARVTRPRTPLLIVFLTAVAMSRPALAEFGGVPDRVQVAAGGTAALLVTNAALTDPALGAGVAVNFEDLFDIPGNDQFARLDGFWRFSDRRYIDFGYVEANRSGATVIDEDVEWGGYTFTAGALVEGTWDSRFPYTAFRYDFLQEDRVKISGSAGLSYLRLAPSLAADGGVTDSNGNVITGAVEQEAEVQFPVPLIGLRIDWSLRDRLFVDMFTRFFYLDYSDFKGGMRESSVRLKWHFTKHVGVALGYDATGLQIKEYETDDYNAKFRYEISGVSGYLTLAF